MSFILQTSNNIAPQQFQTAETAFDLNLKDLVGVVPKNLTDIDPKKEALNRIRNVIDVSAVQLKLIIESKNDFYIPGEIVADNNAHLHEVEFLKTKYKDILDSKQTNIGKIENLFAELHKVFQGKIDSFCGGSLCGAPYIQKLEIELMEIKNRNKSNNSGILSTFLDEYNSYEKLAETVKYYDGLLTTLDIVDDTLKWINEKFPDTK
jgi:hypothetical protein